jgi:hypothetical protein
VKIKNSQVVHQYLKCVHHKKAIKNSRKLTENKRQRICTKIQVNDCKFSLVIAYSKAQEGWVIWSNHLEHNHTPNPNLFSYLQYRNKKPGYIATLAATTIYCSVISYSDSKSLLQKESLPEISKKNFYNLQKKERESILSQQEELEYILQILEAENIHVRPQFENIVNRDREVCRHVIKDLFWMSSE